MKRENPLFFLFKKLSWPVGLIVAAITISSLGSLSGLLVPLFTGRIVDKFSVSHINWNLIALFWWYLCHQCFIKRIRFIFIK